MTQPPSTGEKPASVYAAMWRPDPFIIVMLVLIAVPVMGEFEDRAVDARQAMVQQCEAEPDPPVCVDRADGADVTAALVLIGTLTVVGAAAAGGLWLARRAATGHGSDGRVDGSGRSGGP